MSMGLMEMIETKLVAKPYNEQTQVFVNKEDSTTLLCCQHIILPDGVSCNDLSYNWTGPRVPQGYQHQNLYLPHQQNILEHYKCTVSDNTTDTVDVLFTVRHSASERSKAPSYAIFYTIIVLVFLLSGLCLFAIVYNYCFFMKRQMRSSIESGRPSAKPHKLATPQPQAQSEVQPVPDHQPQVTAKKDILLPLPKPVAKESAKDSADYESVTMDLTSQPNDQAVKTRAIQSAELQDQLSGTLNKNPLKQAKSPPQTEETNRQIQRKERAKKYQQRKPADQKKPAMENKVVPAVTAEIGKNKLGEGTLPADYMRIEVREAANTKSEAAPHNLTAQAQSGNDTQVIQQHKDDATPVQAENADTSNQPLDLGKKGVADGAVILDKAKMMNEPAEEKSRHISTSDFTGSEFTVVEK